MSPIAAGLDGLLILLLLLALGLGLKLNTRLKSLRESQAGFAAAVLELNQAAARAEAGLVALKTASETAHDDLLTRIETARGLVTRLERAGAEAQRTLSAAPERSEPVSRPASQGSARAAIAAMAESFAPERAAGPDLRPATRASAPATRRPARAAFDDDLFERQAPDRGDLGPLRPPRGDR